MKATIFS